MKSKLKAGDKVKDKSAMSSGKHGTVLKIQKGFCEYTTVHWEDDKVSVINAWCLEPIKKEEKEDDTWDF